MSSEDGCGEIVPLLALNTSQYRQVCHLLNQSFTLAMNFDSRIGLKYLIQQISQSTMAANLYQLSSLVWCVQFIVNFYLGSSIKYRDEECLATLGDLFDEVCSLYVDKVKFIQNSREPSKTSTSFVSRKEKDYAQTESSMHGSNELRQAFSLDSSCSFNSNLQPDEQFELVNSGQSVCRMLNHSAPDEPSQENLSSSSPPSATVSRTRVRFADNDELIESDSNEDEKKKRSDDFLLLDSHIYSSMWNDILVNCIELHLNSDGETFRFMLPHYRRLMQTLTIHASDHNLRLVLGKWLNRVVDQTS